MDTINHATVGKSTSSRESYGPPRQPQQPTYTSQQDGQPADQIGLAWQAGSLDTFPFEQHSHPRRDHDDAAQGGEGR